MRRRLRNVPLFTAAVLAIFATFGLAVALAWRSADQRRLEEGRQENCQQIEALKTEFRAEAIEDFAQLPRTARILGIELTPEVRAAAREGRDRTLRRFAPSEC